MITFKRIENDSDPLWGKMYDLYESAFPAVERRDATALKNVMKSENKFQVSALLKENCFVGFFNDWHFEDFVYVEHFAVCPELRGKLIGTEVVSLYLKKKRLPIVFEVEKPDNEVAKRRIALYERLGCHLLPYDYAQPHYDGSGKLFPMLLMTNDSAFVSQNVRRIKSSIYEEVYHYNDNNT